MLEKAFSILSNFIVLHSDHVFLTGFNYHSFLNHSPLLRIIFFLVV